MKDKSTLSSNIAGSHLVDAAEIIAIQDGLVAITRASLSEVSVEVVLRRKGEDDRIERRGTDVRDMMDGRSDHPGEIEMSVHGYDPDGTNASSLISLALDIGQKPRIYASGPDAMAIAAHDLVITRFGALSQRYEAMRDSSYARIEQDNPRLARRLRRGSDPIDAWDNALSWAATPLMFAFAILALMSTRNSTIESASMLLGLGSALAAILLNIVLGSPRSRRIARMEALRAQAEAIGLTMPVGARGVERMIDLSINAPRRP